MTVDLLSDFFGDNELSDEQLAQLATFVQPYLAAPWDAERPVRLSDYDPQDTGGLKPHNKSEARAWLRDRAGWLADRQRTLAAQGRWAVLVVLQGRDAAGKDSTIRHVMSRMNPQGCHVTSFAEPTSLELRHDFLWRYHQHLPARGDVGIFNRSHYEEVLVVRVRPEHLESQKLPASLVTEGIWDQRLRDINAFEEHLAHNGTLIIKMFLNLSMKEQRKRFQRRLNTPDKHWKFSPSDIRDRKHWDAYTHAYEAALNATSKPYAPWYVVPADNKWFARLLVASIIVSEVAKLDLHFPNPFAGHPEILEEARQSLARE